MFYLSQKWENSVQSQEVSFQKSQKLLASTVRPNKKETRFISEISSLRRKIESNYMLHYQGHFLFFHLIPNT